MILFRLIHHLLIASLICCVADVPLVLAQSILIPPNDGFYTQTIDILAPEQEVRVESGLSAYKRKTGDSIVILVVQSMTGTTLASAATSIAIQWKLATSSGRDILVLAALADHEELIQAGEALTELLPVTALDGILETDLRPSFQKGKYEDGLLSTIDALQKHIDGTYTVKRYDPSAGPGFLRIVFVLFLVVLQYAVARLFRERTVWAGAVLGGVFGLYLAIHSSWWLAIPVLVLVGLVFDYLMLPQVRARAGNSLRPPQDRSWDGSRRRR